MLPALNPGTTLAAILTVSPVCGFLPSLASLFLAVKVPNPTNVTSRGEKIVNTYKNASYEPVSKQCALSIKLTDDSMAPIYLKGDRIFFRKKDSYNNGDDIVIAVKGNTLSVRRLYKSNKAIILQAMNPKYQTIVVNVFSEDMILGKVETMSREVR